MSTESDLIQRQRELLRQARVANRTRTDAEARATAQHGQAQQQAEETLAAATQQAETAQRQAQAQADADLRKATSNAQSVFEQTQNQVARRRATAADGETRAQELLGYVALGELYRPVHAQPAPVEPDSRAALQKAADQVAALLRDIEEAVEDLGQQRAEARAKRKALLWWVAAGLLSAPFWLWLQVGGSPPECLLHSGFGCRWLLIFVSLSLIAITVGWRSWNRPRKEREERKKKSSTMTKMTKGASANRAVLTQQAFATRGFVNAVDGALYVHVPAGPFSMGSTDRADEQPVHTVTLNEYWIMQTEVTNAQFQQFVDAGGYAAERYWSAEGWQVRSDEGWGGPRCLEDENFNAPDQPVVCVSWYEAEAYTRWLSEASGVAIRLPTEAEWEKAARGTDGRIFPWGDEFDGSRLNFCDVNCEYDWKDETYDDGYTYTAPVGSYPEGASPYGALDMAGNVWEWVNDWYQEDYYSVSPGSNPQGPATGESRVLRGGSWYSGDNFVRSAIRGNLVPDGWYSGNGFRCVRSQ